MVVGTVLAFAASLHAAPLPELTPVLGQKGALLYSSDFKAPNAKATTKVTAGRAEIIDGLLHLHKLPEVSHPGIARISDAKDFPPLTDLILQADFRWEEKGGFNFQFKKPGRPEHGVPPEYYVSFARSAKPGASVVVQLTDNAPRAVVAKKEMPLEPAGWHRVLIEVRNGEVAVQVDGGEPLRGPCNLASAPKNCPDIGFDNQGVTFESFKIWAIQ
ncbi:MAG: hypothetical protein RLZZ244_925 [Verrucomicrobiota bacterium]